MLGGVVLSMGRAAEDTAVILLTGVVAQGGLPRGLLDKFEALPFTIYYLAAQYQSADDLHKGFGAALTLLVLTVLLYGGARILRAGMENEWKN
jgi:ABC-type phosphate transport system permease subunit